jgi:phenylpropionate dioxygenase-like ring-hydroxylating dioxygenase large terminal subunit
MSNVMDQILRSKLKEILDPSARDGLPSTLPYAAMHDPVLFDFEQELFFERAWQALCLEAELAAPGRRKVATVGKLPVVVVHGNDGKLRGFVNACCHRGYPVAERDGASPLLVRRYHGWSYDLEGRLLRAPQAEDNPSLDMKSIRLASISVETWRGVVFINATPDAETLSESYPALEGFASEAGFDLTANVPLTKVAMEMACDWKLAIDNAIECYHCPSTHSKTLTSLYETAGFGGARWAGAVRHSYAQLTGNLGQHDCIQLIPGTYLAADAVIGVVGRFIPIGPRQTRLEFDFSASPGADLDEASRFARVWQETLAEDREILSRQAVGVSSGRLPAGHLVPGPETCLLQAKRLILDRYQAAFSADDADHS